eukprot:TRINITY_DN2137_c1_g3_i1.p1 TRINITY_DN2137_c1_g3~~TRINITY_DN2137_c1_g3_i1.p1  ORF type:complete len:380 (+),score=40.07 TRINITY_DN2137_c1_g3_i1:45-1184(+)
MTRAVPLCIPALSLPPARSSFSFGCAESSSWGYTQSRSGSSLTDRLSELSGSIGEDVGSVDEYFARLGIQRTSVLSVPRRSTCSTLSCLPPPLVLDPTHATPPLPRWRKNEISLTAEILEGTAALNAHAALPFACDGCDYRDVFVGKRPNVRTVTEYLKGALSSKSSSGVACALLTAVNCVAEQGVVPFTPTTAHGLIAGALAVVTSLEDDEDRVEALLLTGHRVTNIARLERAFVKCLETAARRRLGLRDDAVGSLDWGEVVGSAQEGHIRAALRRAARWHHRTFAMRACGGAEEGAVPPVPKSVLAGGTGHTPRAVGHALAVARVGSSSLSTIPLSTPTGMCALALSTGSSPPLHSPHRSSQLSPLQRAVKPFATSL